MAKVSTLKSEFSGAKFEAPLRVDSKGMFSVRRPGTEDDWPDVHMDISSKTAEEAEAKWRQAVKDFSERTRKDRKVIIVRFDSILREGGKRGIFTNHDAMILLRAIIALETTTKQGDKVTSGYREHPDYCGVHAPPQPFPSGMRLDSHTMRHPREDCCVVEWSQDLENTIVRACHGIQAVVDMLDGVLTSPEKMLLAAAQVARLPMPAQTEAEQEA